MCNKILNFAKKEAVFCISFCCAVVTMFIVPPDKEYLGYIDFRVLCLLLCLMAVVAGFKSIGAFDVLTNRLMRLANSGRTLSLSLVLLPFFASMLVTNDVALIVFVPFTIALLTQLGYEKKIVTIIVLQTVGANLGSMATPVGNPQNLFIFSNYNLEIGDFFAVTLPLTAVSLLALAVASLPALPHKLNKHDIFEEKSLDKKGLIIFSFLFVLCLLTVFRFIPYQVTTAVLVLVLTVYNRKLFKEIDFMLLITFVCFFVISENLGRIELIRNFLQEFLSRNTLITSVGASQIISNVPAAVLLSGFTDNWKELLAGVNIGGLGTPIASLASLITLKLYLKAENAKFLKFIAVFTVANIAGLILLLCFELLI